MTSVEDKPLTGEQAQQLAKRELASDLARKAAEDTSRAAVAAAKFEGDYGRIMTTAAPAPAAEGEAAPAETPSVEKPGEQPQTEEPKK